MAEDLIEYDVPELEAELEVDFLDGRDLAEMEAGIQKIATATDLLTLVAGVAIVKIEREGLWRQGGYDNLRAYRIDQAERLAMPASTISNRRRIAEAWLSYRKPLSRYDLSGHVQKLVYLEDAVALHGKQKALSSFWSMSYREFKAFARPSLAAPELAEVEVGIHVDAVYIDGEPVLRMEEGLADEEKGFVLGILKRAYQARKGNLLAHVVGVYDEGEARAVDGFLKKLRASK